MKSITRKFWLTFVIVSSGSLLTVFQNCAQTTFGSSTAQSKTDPAVQDPLGGNQNGSNGGFDGKVSYVHRGGACAQAPHDVDTRFHLNDALTEILVSRENCADIQPARSIPVSDIEYVDVGPGYVVYKDHAMVLDREESATVGGVLYPRRVTLLACRPDAAAVWNGPRFDALVIWYLVDTPAEVKARMFNLEVPIAQNFMVDGTLAVPAVLPVNTIAYASGKNASGLPTLTFTLRWDFVQAASTVYYNGSGFGSSTVNVNCTHK